MPEMKCNPNRNRFGKDLFQQFLYKLNFCIIPLDIMLLYYFSNMIELNRVTFDFTESRKFTDNA